MVGRHTPCCFTCGRRRRPQPPLPPPLLRPLPPATASPAAAAAVAAAAAMAGAAAAAGCTCHGWQRRVGAVFSCLFWRTIFARVSSSSLFRLFFAAPSPRPPSLTREGARSVSLVPDEHPFLSLARATSSKRWTPVSASYSCNHLCIWRERWSWRKTVRGWWSACVAHGAAEHHGT